jgi:hypothetical protein
MRRGEVDLGTMSADVACFAARASADDGATEPTTRGSSDCTEVTTRQTERRPTTAFPVARAIAADARLMSIEDPEIVRLRPQ